MKIQYSAPKSELITYVAPMLPLCTSPGNKPSSFPSGSGESPDEWSTPKEWYDNVEE